MIVFGEHAIRPFIDSGADLPPTAAVLDSLDSAIGTSTVGGHSLIAHRSDTESSRLIIVSESEVKTVARLGSQPLARLLERVDRASRAFWDPPVFLPTAWNKYQWENRLAFFALPPAINPEAWRWIVERLRNSDLVFWKLTSHGDEESLQTYEANYGAAEAARQSWVEALTEIRGNLPAESDSPRPLQPAVDLEVVGSRAISRGRSYAAWGEHLTPDQWKVLNFTGSHALKVRGPAGTGKTLVLQLKALHELYQAAERGPESFRVLYLTHSWALAELVDRSILVMDNERALARGALDVMPVAWLRELLYGELPEGVEVLGDDSVEGKRRQLTLISAVIDSLLASDWPTYRPRASERLAVAVESLPDSSDRIGLCWNLMREFAEVIDAHQLKPGLDSLRKYLEIPREPWMVPLLRAADREFAFAVYREFVRRLVGEGQLTTDQGLDDLRKYLESYTWNLRRLKDGYDLVLVDEFHLFNDTERYLVHLLTRDAEAPPRLVLALDPYQSTFTLLTGIGDGELSRAARQNLPGLAPAESLDLKTVHRFSTEIHAFVDLIHKSFPNLLDLGSDWTFDFADTTTSGVRSTRPRISTQESLQAAAQKALDLANHLNSQTPASERVAVIGASIDELAALKSHLVSDARNRRAVVVDGRDDIDQLNYSRKLVAVSAAEFCAGLQFAHVICVAFVGEREEGTSALRAGLSNLYLAVTRAEQSLTLVVVGSHGPIHDVLERALRMGIATDLDLSGV